MNKLILLLNESEFSDIDLPDELFSAGYDVVLGDEHWRGVAKNRKVDLVVLGAQGPRGVGLELVLDLRRALCGKQVPVLMIGNKLRNDGVHRAIIKRYGLNGFLERPLDVDQAMLPIQRLLLEPDTKTTPKQLPSDSPKEDLTRSPASVFSSGRLDGWTPEAFHDTLMVGSLQRTPVPELLSQFLQEKATGAALFNFDMWKKLIYFKEGTPVFVTSNRLDECLGKLLTKAKIITDTQCQRSLEEMKKTGRKQGEVLIEMGLLTPPRIQSALEFQHQVKLMDLFGWSGGTYQFTSKLQPPQVDVSFQSSLEDVIYRGVRRNFSLPRLRSLLQEHLDQVVVPIPHRLSRFKSVKLQEPETRFFEKLSGNSTLRNVSPAGLSEEHLFQLVYAFKCSGMVEFISPIGLGEATKPSAQEDKSKPPAGELKRTIGDQYLSNLAASLKATLVQKLMQMGNEDCFGILGVPKNASALEISNAFHLLAKKYHPERKAGRASPEIRKLLNDLYSKICWAYSTLDTASKRRGHASWVQKASRPVISL